MPTIPVFSMRLATSQYLNSVNDPAPGVPLASPSGSIVQSYGGFVGMRVELDDAMASKLSDPAVGTLYGGIYQYVKFSATDLNFANPNRGRLVFWDATAPAVYQVNQLETTNGSHPLFAGVLIGAPTAGNYGFIQIAGRATVLCRAVVTAATRNLNWTGAGVGADNATFDGIADATAVTQLSNEGQLAVGEVVAANATLILADLYDGKFIKRF